MQWWYYRGQITTPIDIPGKGPTVLRPREKFQAPFTSVVHLRKIGWVVACKPPKGKKVAPKPESQSKAIKQSEVRAGVPMTVVASKSNVEEENQEKATEKPLEKRETHLPEGEEEGGE